MSYTAQTKKRFLGALGLLCGTLVLVLGVFWKGALPFLARTRASYIEHRVQLATIEERVDSLQEIRKEFHDVEDELTVVHGAFIKSDGIPLFIETVEEAAQKTGNTFTINSAREMRNSETGQLTHIDFDTSVKGNFQNVLAFLSALRRSGYLIHISEIQMSQTNERSFTTALRFTALVDE